MTQVQFILDDKRFIIILKWWHLSKKLTEPVFETFILAKNSKHTASDIAHAAFNNLILRNRAFALRLLAIFSASTFQKLNMFVKFFA